MRIRIVAVGLLAWLPVFAAGAYPVTERGWLQTGSPVVDLAVSDDDRLVGVATTDGTLYLFDTAAFSASPDSYDACSGATSVSYTTVDNEPWFLVTCTDGTVAVVSADDQVYPAVWNASDSYEVGTGSLDAGGVSPDDGLLFAVEDGSEDLIHVLDLADMTVDGISGFPMTSYYGIACMDVSPLGTYVIMGNDQGRVTKLFNSGGVYTLATFAMYGLSSFVDVATVDEAMAYFIDSSGMLIAYTMSADDTYIVLSNDLGSPEAMDIVYASEGTYFYVMQADGVMSVVPFAGGDAEVEVTLSTSFAGGIGASSASDGYVYVGGNEGVAVVSEAPWVEVTGVEPELIYEGESSTLSFTADVDASYQIYRGGGIDQSGTHLSQHDGSIAAGETVSVVIDGEDLEEAGNQLFVFATADGFTGRDSASITLDTPPDEPSGFEVSFGNEKLMLAWDANDEIDVTHYQVYFADSEFDEASGAPEFQVDGVNDGEARVIESPAKADQPDDYEGKTVTYTLEYLTNGVEYCIAVSGVDGGGQEGPWTETLCDSPEETIGAGDNLGYCGSCGVSSEPGASLAAALSMLGLTAALVGRRRR